MTYQRLLEELLKEKVEELKNEGVFTDFEIEEKIDDKLSEVFSEKFVSKHARDILNMLEPQSPIMYEENRLMMQEFESRLQMRWLDAFYIAQLFITISIENTVELINEFFEQAETSSDGKKYISIFYSEMILLQKQAIILAKEINHLLKGGYSEAAFSRWRSLFEVSVIMKCMVKAFDEDHKNGELVATEFYVSGIVKKIEVVVDEEKDTLKNEIKKLKIDKNREDELKKDYEWFRTCINKSSKSKIYFNDLIDYSESKNLYDQYKEACQYIHISSYGLHYQLAIDNSFDSLVFGPSNVGLSKPFQLLLVSILSTTRSFLSLDYTIDRAIQIKMLELIVKDTLKNIEEIDEQIIAEEESSNDYFDN